MNREELPKDHVEIYKNLDSVTKEDMICDYIAGMSDQYSVRKFEELYVPSFWKL